MITPPYRIHELKSWPDFYDPILRKERLFEIRKETWKRRFRVEDILWLREYHPYEAKYTGRQIVAHVPYLLRGPSWDIAADTVVMSVQILTANLQVDSLAQVELYLSQAKRESS